jgi:predicted aspartyl protease
VRALCLILLAWTTAANGQGASAPKEFPFTNESGLLWIKVHVAGREQPLGFLLDSGAQVSVINLGTARRLGMRLGSKVTVRGVNTVRTGHWPQELDAEAGGVPLPDRCLALDLSTFSRACGRPVDGLIGADFFRERIVQIDYLAGMVRLLDSTESLSRSNAIPLESRECGFRVKISVNSVESQWMRVDTGCASALQWANRRVGTGECSDLIAVGLAETKIPQMRTIVTLAGQTLRDVPTGVHAKPIFPGEAGLLGNALLSRFRSVTLDNRSHLLLLGELR